MGSRFRHRAIRILDGPHAGQTTWQIVGTRRFTSGRPMPRHERDLFPPLEDHEYKVDEAARTARWVRVVGVRPSLSGAARTPAIVRPRA